MGVTGKGQREDCRERENREDQKLRIYMVVSPWVNNLSILYMPFR